ncbi:MAG: AAA family ATPase, partial [Bdellovibrionales bacterium]|nr:AAA family ATPase [Bdellovibrionales bacterium]
MLTLDEVLNTRGVVLAAGTGGVGKTTLSAALAVRAALQGRKAVVITVDPAKRLAQSLGMDRLSDEPTDLTPLLLKAAPSCKGSLWAVIPDTRRTFERFVRSLADSEAAYERVVGNPIFRIFAKEYSGTNEYMSLKRLD